MADEGKLRKEIAETDEAILQTRIRLDEINRRMATASEAELTVLKQTLEKENLILQYQQEGLKAAQDTLEAQRKIAEAAKDSASALEDFIDNSSISNKLSDELADKYKSIGSKAGELADLAKDNAEDVRKVAEFNRKVLEIETVREKLVNAAREGDADELGIQERKMQSLTGELNAIISNNSYTDEQVRLMEKILQIQRDVTAEHLNTISLTEQELEQYNELIKDANSLQTKMEAIGSMISLFLKKPTTLIGASIIALGSVVSKIGEVNKKLGTSMLSMSGFSASAGVLSFIFDDAADTAKELAHHLGDSRKVTFGMQLDTNMIASNLNLTGAEAAELVSQFGEMRGQTHDQAMNMIASAEATAKARGVVPADLVKDLAANTEAFSKFAKGGGENMLAAAAGARQLGVDLKTVTTMADTLLDFESSIEKELELSAMLGKDINLNKARELFYAGDLEGATKAVIEQLGNKAEFDKMDVFQKKAAADALGIQVTELEKMYKNQENLAGTSGVIAKEYSRISEISSYIANEWGGGILKGVGSAVIALGQFGTGVKSIGEGASGIKDAFKSIKEQGLGGALKSFFGAGKAAAPPSVPGLPGAAPSPTAPPTAGPEKANSFGNINGVKLMQAAAALLIVAAALWVFAKAAQEFGGNIDWTNVFIGIGALTLLGIVAAGLSTVGVMILAGAGALLIASAAFYVFGLASQEVSKGMTMLGVSLPLFAAGMVAFTSAPYVQFALGLYGLAASMVALGTTSPFMLLASVAIMSVATSLTALIPVIPTLVEQISALSQLNFLPIFGLAAALTALAMALSAVAVAGVLALPALAGIGMIAGAVGGLFGGEEKGGENKELLDEIKGLRADLNSGKVAVYMDGHKVTAAVAAANASSPLTLR